MGINLDTLDQKDKIEKLEDAKNELKNYDHKLIEMFSIIQSTKSSIAQIKKNVAEQKKRDFKKCYEEFEEMSREYFQIKEKMLEFPNIIKEQKEHVSDLKDVVNSLKEELELVESTLFMKINNAKDEKGRAKYTNKAAREAGLKKSKQNNEEYLKAKQKLDEAESELEQAKFELDKLNNEYKSYRYVAKMSSNRMRVLG